MQIHDLKPVHENKPVMLVGRGGKRGKTSGRGTKGQNARAGHKNRPEMRDFIKRIPKLRGRGVSPFKSFAVKPFEVKLSDIEHAFKAGDTINPEILVKKGIVPMLKGKTPKVKILGIRSSKEDEKKSETKKYLISGCLVSAGAKAAIEKAGGSVTL
jgi:large subunit ribosomal protein L15